MQSSKTVPLKTPSRELIIVSHSQFCIVNDFPCIFFFPFSNYNAFYHGALSSQVLDWEYNAYNGALFFFCIQTPCICLYWNITVHQGQYFLLTSTMDMCNWCDAFVARRPLMHARAMHLWLQPPDYSLSLLLVCQVYFAFWSWFWPQG